MVTNNPDVNQLAFTSLAFKNYLDELVKKEGVLPTNPIPGISTGYFSTDPGWITKDLNGLLMASIDNYDRDIYPELFTLSVRTESEPQDEDCGFLTGVIIRKRQISARIY